MREPDREQFLQAVQDEVQAHTEAGNWLLTLAANVPPGSTVLLAVWQMKRKCRIASTWEVYKHKAMLNIHRSQQVKGVNFWQAFAPVATWGTIRIILIMALMGRWQTRQIDYVLAYTQADAECTNMYMRIPKGFKVEVPVDLSLIHI